MTPHPYGSHAALLLFDDAAEVQPWVRAARDANLPGVVDVVPGARSVVIVGDPARTDADALIAALRTLSQPGTFVRDTGPTFQVGKAEVEVPVTYDGEDLAEVAARTGLTVDEVVAAHAEAAYEVAFCGFAPGFAYLTGLPAALRLPRRDTPRPRVPAGSVAIAAAYSAVYPQASPGGWWLLGRTALTMWDADRDPPALLQPGDRVRFVAT
ncbi:MAG TPA: 5-oxoprolinase subunit PxpB [Egibacteraceae bacterium]|nr:5-oxoprolinase subunit PxpB [Egibacteraceae bacterium]